MIVDEQIAKPFLFFLLVLFSVWNGLVVYLSGVAVWAMALSFVVFIMLPIEMLTNKILDKYYG